LNVNRKAGVDVKLNDIIRKRALYAVAVFCTAAIATVGALTMGGNEEETPESYVDLNEVAESGENKQQVAEQPDTTGKEEIKEIQFADQDTEPQQAAEQTEVTGQETEVAENKEEEVLPEVTEDPVETADKEPVKKEEETKPAEVLSPQLIAEQLNFNKEAGLLRPIEGEVIIPYSPDHGVFHYTLDQFSTSDAVILSSSVGTEVKAAAKGVVIDIEEHYRTGMTVTLALGNNTSLVYGQLELADLEEGDIVEAGECIGTVAEPTRYYVVEGPSLYFKVVEGEETLDPTVLFGGK